jgi:predicted PurR-regulated permease PerM
MPAEAPSQRSAGIVVLATIAVLAALYVAREFLVPIGLTILFTSLLRPVVRRFERARLPAPVGATIVLVVFVGLLAVAGMALADPARAWVAQAPQTLAAAQKRVQALRRPLQVITTTARKMADATTGTDARAEGQATQAPPAPQPSPAAPALAARVFGTTTALLGGLVETVLLTFLLLASGDAFMAKLVKVLPVMREKREAVAIAGEAESVVAHYMVVTALINAGQGALVGLAMWLLHLPNPVLWGILTFVLEFIPYLGGASMLILLTLAGLATFDHVGQALLPPLVYLAITTLQNNLVSPVAYGRRLRLNPPAVFVGVLFWWFLWGVPGAFLAVPILATARILGEHLEPLAPLGEFLAD